MADDIKKDLEERFAQLPRVVQSAIKSADVEKSLRALADTHKLHLDQWGQLENEVMLVLLGFESPDNMQKNIKDEVGVSDEIATALTVDISRIVFEPIRQELERELEHPDAKAKEESAVEGMRTQVLGQQSAVSFQLSEDAKTQQSSLDKIPEPESGKLKPESSVIPATPPPAPPTEKAIRMPTSGAYKPGEASAVRKDIADDPYRETPT
jgi:hypothetical protein